MHNDRMIPLKKLKVGCLYEAQFVDKEEDKWYGSYGNAVYKGNGEWWTAEYDRNADGKKDWRKGRILRARKDNRVDPGEGSVKPIEEIGMIEWETDEQLMEWLEDSYAKPRIERRNLVRFDVDPRWLSSTVIDLCRTMREEDNYKQRLPILSDALQDAGCDDEKLIAACQKEKCKAYAQRIVALLLGGELAEAVKWLEEFGERWNFAYRDMIEEAQVREGGLTAMGIDLHGADELTRKGSGENDANRYWECVELLTGKCLRKSEEDFYWSCSC